MSDFLRLRASQQAVRLPASLLSLVDKGSGMKLSSPRIDTPLRARACMHARA
jgi:hypothetical protein